VSRKILSRRPLNLLKMLYEQGKPITTYTLEMKQNELAKELEISRQALNVHLRKLRDLGYIRTGRGFIDVTEGGLKTLGVSATPAFIFIKVSPLKRGEAYRRIMEFPIQRFFRVAGDMDAVLVIEREELEETLRKLAFVDGVQDTKSYITIQVIK